MKYVEPSPPSEQAYAVLAAHAMKLQHERDAAMRALELRGDENFGGASHGAGGVAHYVIAAPGKDARALDALRKAGINAKMFPAIMAGPLSDSLAQMPYHRFGGGTIARTPSSHGAWLSHMALVAMGRALGVEWLGVWEDDLGAGNQIGWRELRLPTDCGVVHLGGILWGRPQDYGEPMGDGLWRVTQPRPISGTHAVMIHRRAMDDVLASYARCDMTEDDLLSCACIDAMRDGRWSTCFVQPWLAWQVDRRETWPTEMI